MMRRDRVLLILMILYGAASLTHFIHNALYIDAYPNLPAWLTPARVYAAWLVIAAIGVVGYWLLRSISQAVGLVVIGVYAGLGYAGLDHYALAPMSAHSAAMNITIICEVIAASLLMIAVVWSALRHRPADRGFRSHFR